MEIGNALASNSAVAIEMVSLVSSDHGIKDGAPSESCNDLAPVILALSNRVSLGGPIITVLPSAINSLTSNSISG